MSGNNLDLNLLKQKRDALLLAEAIGWLHDYRKCSDEHLRVQAANASPNAQAIPRNELVRRHHCLTSASFQIPIQSSSCSVANLLDRRRNQYPWGQFLSRCHNTSHFDKQEPVGGEQNYPGIKISTPFGFEADVLNDLTNGLWNLPWNDLCNYSDRVRDIVLSQVSSLFAKTVADTRRPINEVDLWSWGLLVGSLYKAALAGVVLTGHTPAARDLHWRLLAIRIDGLGYLLNVANISDLFARQDILSDGLNRVQCLLEVTYPLGSEVYRDENGSVYVVPDVANLLSSSQNGNTLRELILQEFQSGTLGNKINLQINGEIGPRIELEASGWWGQDPRWPQSSRDELPGISSMLPPPYFVQADAGYVRHFWKSGIVADICTTCGLRPQGPGKKAAARNVCNICEERRADRSQEWLGKLDTTIWTNEVADTNGRLALVVGRFNLTHWLSGNLVRTLAVREPNDRNGHDADKIAKNPSFARLRRIWETTRRFWQEVCPAGGDDADANLARSLMGEKTGQKGPRLAVEGAFRPRNEGENNSTLFPAHAYALVLPNGVRLSVVWDAKNNRFIVADNLEYLSGKTQLGEDIRAVLKKGRTFTVEEPAGYGEKNKVLGKISLSEDTETVGSEYTPVIPLLAEPQTFMALIPAEKALAAVAAVKEKYEREAGKVRNRLPLHLGVVFAHRRTPVRAVLDAGRQMLRQSGEAKGWRVICSARKLACRGDQPPERFAGDKQFNECFEVTLEKDDRRVTWYVPAVMGDGNTEDKWYPYVFLETGTEPTDRARRYKTCNPWTGNDGWLVHVCELKVDDKVFFTPSTIDYEFLDVTSRRFEIHYDEAGRRSTRRTRPYYLDDLNRLDMVWAHMKKLERAQRYKVISAIEATREAWFGEDRDDRSIEDKVFRRFAHDTLAGAAWPKTHKWAGIDEKERKALIEAGVRGELADLAELHMEICKEKG